MRWVVLLLPIAELVAAGSISANRAAPKLPVKKKAEDKCTNKQALECWRAPGGDLETCCKNDSPTAFAQCIIDCGKGLCLDGACKNGTSTFDLDLCKRCGNQGKLFEESRKVVASDAELTQKKLGIEKARKKMAQCPTPDAVDCWKKDDSTVEQCCSMRDRAGYAQCVGYCIKPVCDVAVCEHKSELYDSELCDRCAQSFSALVGEEETLLRLQGEKDESVKNRLKAAQCVKPEAVECFEKKGTPLSACCPPKHKNLTEHAQCALGCVKARCDYGVCTTHGIEYDEELCTRCTKLDSWFQDLLLHTKPTIFTKPKGAAAKKMMPPALSRHLKAQREMEIRAAEQFKNQFNAQVQEGKDPLGESERRVVVHLHPEKVENAGQ